MANIGIHGATGILPIFSTAVISSENSSTSTLAGNATFTGTALDVSNYARVSVIVYSDVSSAAGGLKIEFSPDGTNWIDSSNFTFTAGGTPPNAGQGFDAAIRGQFLRVVYINGSSAQAAFILETMLRPHGASGGDAIDLSTSPLDTNHAVLSKSLIIGRTTAGGGSYVSVKVNPSGALAVDTTAATTDLTPSSPTAATVGVASAQALASNANRKGLVLVNTSNNRISLAFGATAVLDSGITLYPGGVFEMDAFMFDTGAVNAIASAATSNLAIQEYTT